MISTMNTNNYGRSGPSSANTSFSGGSPYSPVMGGANSTLDTNSSIQNNYTMGVQGNQFNKNGINAGRNNNMIPGKTNMPMNQGRQTP